MKNELPAVAPSNVPATTVNQQGHTNVHVDRAENITQNITLIPVVQHTSSGGMRPTTQAVNNEYYHLFVMGGESFEQNHFIVPADRALAAYWTTDELREKYGRLSDENIEKLKTFPALFMPEAEGYYARPTDEQQAYLGIIEDIRIQDNGIKIRWRMIWPIPMQQISSIGFELGIKDMTRALSELNRTHWAIKHINLIEELKDAKITLFGIT